jgi:hypothetical protein
VGGVGRYIRLGGTNHVSACIMGLSFSKTNDRTVSDVELLSGFKHPYEHGLLCSAGEHDRSEPPILELLVPLPEGVDGPNVYVNRSLLPPDLAAMFVVPANHVLDEKMRWLEGLADGGGRVLSDGSLRLSSGDRTTGFMLGVKRMLDAMGANPEITTSSTGSRRHGLRIDPVDLAKLRALGFSPKRV